MPADAEQRLPQMVILAGGRGMRLRPLSGARPKALMPVAGRPFIEHQLELLAGNGARRILLCLGVGAKQIEKHVGDGRAWGLAVSYSREAPHRLAGTGGALVHALPLLENEFGVMYGDSYLTADYCAVYTAFCCSGKKGLMTVFLNRDAWDKSNVRVEDRHVVYYSKAAPPGAANYIDYGLTFYRREVPASHVFRPVPFDLSVMVSDLVAAHELAAYEVSERFYEIGKPKGWAELDALLSAK